MHVGHRKVTEGVWTAKKSKEREGSKRLIVRRGGIRVETIWGK